MSDGALKNRENAFSELVKTVNRLRAPGGCPWDRAQTHQTLRPFLIEEAYEVLDVLDRIESPEALKQQRDPFKEELGDLLMQVVLHSEMSREAGVFDVYDVAQTLNEKLIRRHPHVFGEHKANSADEALGSWEKQKALEKAAKNNNENLLDGIPKNLPSLQKAARVLQKVGAVGFQWDDVQGAFEKVVEELAEIKQAVSAKASQDKIEDELGDLLFTACSVGHYLKVDPEAALRRTVEKFKHRFEFVENELRKIGKTPSQSTLAEMDALWEKAKLREKKS